MSNQLSDNLFFSPDEEFSRFYDQSETFDLFVNDAPELEKGSNGNGVYNVVKSSVGKNFSKIKRVALSTFQGHSSEAPVDGTMDMTVDDAFFKIREIEDDSFSLKEPQRKRAKMETNEMSRKRKRSMTEAEIKEKNRMYAKQHRLDKKRQHEALLKRNEQLELENQRLRTMLASLGIGVTKKIGGLAISAGSAPIKYGGKAVHSVGKGAYNMLFSKKTQQPISEESSAPIPIVSEQCDLFSFPPPPKPPCTSEIPKLLSKTGNV